MRSKTKSQASQHSYFSSSQSDKNELLSKMIPFLELQQIKSQLAQHEYPSQTLHTSNPALQNLKYLQQQISTRMYQLDQLNCQFYEKQQKLFLKTFVNMMDRMSNQMMEFKEKYRNIDEEINQLQQCVELRKKLEFFKGECLFLGKQFMKGNQQLMTLQEMNKQKQRTNNLLRNQLLSECKSSHKYKCRKNSLQTKLDNIDFSLRSKATNHNERSHRSVCSNTGTKGLTLQLPKRPHNSQRPQTARLTNLSLTSNNTKQQAQTTKYRNKSDYSHRQANKNSKQCHKDKKTQNKTNTKQFNKQYECQMNMVEVLASGRRTTKYRERIKYYG